MLDSKKACYRTPETNSVFRIKADLSLVAEELKANSPSSFKGESALRVPMGEMSNFDPDDLNRIFEFLEVIDAAEMADA